MRGKVSFVRMEIISFGITPAYAGKSPPHTRYTHTQWDHPRLCGEKDGMRRLWRRGVGSPPPMRGKALGRQLPEDAIRITPAYAGKRSRKKQTVRESQDHPRLCGEKCRYRGIDTAKNRDHPRLCGEKQRIEEKKQKVQGSPPPMRGKEPHW